MKLLGWMRHKIKQTRTEPFKEFKAGSYYCLSAQASHDDQDVHPKSYSGSRNNSDLPNQIYGNPEPHGVQMELEDEISMANDKFFHGLLAIGTLGAEPTASESEPCTPKFAAPQENVNEEAMKDDLRFISDELEKFLDFEAEEGYNQSARRSSHASIITLSGIPIEGADSEENGETAVFPLEGYLLASSIDFPNPDNDVKKRKGSGSGLFRRRKVVDENSIEKYGKTEMHGDLKHKHGRRFPIKKIMKKLFTGPKISESALSTEHDSVPTKEKLQKVVQTFHGKIHPEISSAESKDNMPYKDKIQNALSSESYISIDFIHQHEKDNEVLSSDKGFLSFDSDFKRPQCKVEDTSSNRKREKWIKTDAEYLVLEL